MPRLRINGDVRDVNVPPDTPLLWVLNEQLGLTGTKYSCGISECGACTVLINGEPVLSCGLPVSEAEGVDIVTIEGLHGPVADALRNAWIAEDVVQCGYCQPAQLLTAAALLSTNFNPSDEDIDAAMSDVICRCGTYQAIRKAIHRAAGEIRHEKK